MRHEPERAVNPTRHGPEGGRVGIVCRGAGGQLIAQHAATGRIEDSRGDAPLKLFAWVYTAADAQLLAGRTSCSASCRGRPCGR